MRAVRRCALGFTGTGLLLASLAGCSGSANTTAASSAARSDVGGAAAPSPAANGQPATAAGGSAIGDNVESLDKPPAETGRKIVSTATMTVQVDDVVATKQKASALVTGLEPNNVLFAEQTSLPTGGTSGSVKSPTSTLTFKVAPDKFNEVLADLGGLGKLSAQEVKTDDVTQQVIDVDARVKAAEESTARVTDLVAKTSSLTELATLENEVEKRQADLESLRGQQRTLAARTDLATIILTLTATPPPPLTTEPAGPKPLPGFLDGLSGGWEAMVGVVTVVGAVAGALLPFAWIPVLLYVGWRLVRRRRLAEPEPTRPAPPAAAPAAP